MLRIVLSLFLLLPLAAHAQTVRIAEQFGIGYLPLFVMRDAHPYQKNPEFVRKLRDVAREVSFHDCGKLFFAFTVFYAYIHFSQYFLIWNAAVPEETFWYVLREKGSWFWVGHLILFGHFFLPFLVLLNQSIKDNLVVMIPVAVWAWNAALAAVCGDTVVWKPSPHAPLCAVAW